MRFNFLYNTPNSLVRNQEMVSLDPKAGQLLHRPADIMKGTPMNMDELMGTTVNNTNPSEYEPEMTDPLKVLRNQSLYMGVSALQGLSSLSGNSYQNSLKRYNQQKLAPELNKNLYSTDQDLYGTSYAKLGGLKRYEDGGDFQNLANEYNFLAQENPEDADFYHNQATEQMQQFQAFQQKQMQDAMYETLEQHAANAVAPVQEEIYPYTPQPWSTTLGPQASSPQTQGYTPTYAPPLNIGMKSKTSDNAQTAFEYFKQKGLPPHQAAGIVGNFGQESNVNPNITNSIGAFGVGQWLGPRKKALFEFAQKRGKPATDLQTQLDFTLHELQTTERTASNALAKARTTAEAAKVIRKKYERPGEHEANDARRINLANNLFYK